MKLLKVLVLYSVIIGFPVVFAGPTPLEGYRQVDPKSAADFQRAVWIAIGPAIDKELYKCPSNSVNSIVNSADSVWMRDDRNQPLFLFEYLNPNGTTLLRVFVSTTPDFRSATSVKMVQLEETLVNHGDLLHPDLRNEFLVVHELICFEPKPQP